MYLTLLMERLLVLLETGAVPVKITVTGAIGSAAHAAKEQFKPYFEQTIKRLVPFIHLTGADDQSDLRGVATDTIGTIADAVGAEVFRPYFQDLMKSAFEESWPRSLRENSPLIYLNVFLPLLRVASRTRMSMSSSRTVSQLPSPDRWTTAD
jgi:hypothetical protein